MSNDDWILTEAVERERLLVLFIAKYTGLPEPEANRIYNLGKPWPIARFPNMARLAEETGADLSAVDSALGMMYGTDAEQLETKFHHLKKSVARGEPFTSIPELEERSEMWEHIEKLVNRTGEDRETLVQVADAMLTYLLRLQNLT